MSYCTALRCMDCGRDYGAGEAMVACPDCGPKGLFFGMLDPVYDVDGIGRAVSRKTLEERPLTHWKYREFMPVSAEAELVTMGEGGTPLIRSKNLAGEFGFENLFFKNEALNPTYSFKDRAMSLMVTRAVEEGYRTAALVSDGNCGAAAAAYCARAGIECYVFMPTSCMPSKVAPILMYGAKVIMVKGQVFDAAMLCIDACTRYGWTNISQVKLMNPIPAEGQKTLAFEICEQLGWRSPDWLLTPTTGESFWCQWKGYREFHQLGFIENLPRMVAVQGEGADPVVRAFDRGRQWYELEPFEPETICDAIPVGNVLGPGALQVIRDSNGWAVAVADEETLLAHGELAAREGLFVEPTSAIPLMAAKKLLEQGIIRASDTVVCVATGAGPNVPEVADRQVNRPTPIEPNMEALDKAL